MLKQQPVTAYQVDSLIMDKYHSKMSPSVIYARLAIMERQGLIECHPDHGKTYSLTEKGKQLLSKKTMITKEIRSAAVTLFEN
jgi:DNA-binding PadR family transcriptional regulator